MYLVTNRAMGNGHTMRVFGDTPNAAGPNELRMVQITEKNGKREVELIDDELSSAKVKQLKTKFNLDIDTTIPWHGSLEVACNLFEKSRDENKPILVFVHGYNNDVNDVYSTATELERIYNIIVLPFTWPANGGGKISGSASYLSDKADARASAEAFNRFIGKVHYFYSLLAAGCVNEIQHKVNDKYRDKDNPMAAAALYTEMISKACKVKINLLCHSMGNYLLKHSMKQSHNTASMLLFDNINLVAADANNEDHHVWVERLDVRCRINIVINENDAALRASRIKPGGEQLARLGHYLKKLNSDNATYLNITHVEFVGDDHSYFKGKPVAKNTNLRALFYDIFRGESVEQRLTYSASENYYFL